MSVEKRSSRRRNTLLALLLGTLLALPAHAAETSGSWWDALLDSVSQLFGGDDPEGGLSIEPGG